MGTYDADYGFQTGAVLESVDELISCKAPQTQQVYHKTLDIFSEFLGVKRDSFRFERALKDFPILGGTKFLRWLRERGSEHNGERLSDNTISLRVVILRRVFRHICDIGQRRGNPFAILKDVVPTRQKKQKRPTKLVPFALVPQILDAPDDSTKEGRRDRAILAVMFGGGLRRSEVIKLNIQDIGQTPEGVPYLILRSTKAGVHQEQSLPAWAWLKLSTYLEQRDADGASGSDPLFVFYYGCGAVRGRISDSTLVRLYKRYTSEAGLAGAACHSARATAATMLKMRGVEDRDVARFLRHSTEQMVRVYDKRAFGPELNPGRSLEYRLKKGAAQIQ